MQELVFSRMLIDQVTDVIAVEPNKRAIGWVKHYKGTLFYLSAVMFAALI